jgi:hypothetical protein
MPCEPILGPARRTAISTTRVAKVSFIFREPVPHRRFPGCLARPLRPVKPPSLAWPRRDQSPSVDPFFLRWDRTPNVLEAVRSGVLS